MRQPAPPTKIWDKQLVMDFLTTLYDDLYPKNQAWVPTSEGLTGSVSASYFRQGGLVMISVFVTGPTVANSGTISLPFSVLGDYILNVKAGAAMLPAYVQKSSSTLNLPDWNEAGNVILSGIIAV